MTQQEQEREREREQREQREQGIYQQYQTMLKQLETEGLDSTDNANDYFTGYANAATGVGQNMNIGAAERIRPCAIGQSSTDIFIGATLPYAHASVLQSGDEEFERDVVDNISYISRTQRQREAANKIDASAYAALGLKGFIYELVCATLVILIGMAVGTLILAVWRPDILQRWIGGIQ